VIGVWGKAKKLRGPEKGSENFLWGVIGEEKRGEKISFYKILCVRKQNIKTKEESRLF